MHLALPLKQANQDKSNNTYSTTFMSVLMSASLGLRLIQVYLNPKLRYSDLKLTHRLWGTIGNVLMSPFLRQGQNDCWQGLTFIIDWKAVSKLTGWWKWSVSILLKFIYFALYRMDYVGELLGSLKHKKSFWIALHFSISLCVWV